jgi:acetyl-CoA C-acetyltransferase
LFAVCAKKDEVSGSVRGVTVELHDLDMDQCLVNLYIDLCNERLNFLIDKPRRVAVVGGNRIPFARSNSVYSRASNQDMLTAALDGLVARFSLEGERLGEVAGGAVLKHSRDRDLTRESVLGTRLAPETPAYDVQQACGTGLETTILVANKIALGQVDAGIACGADTTSDAPIGLNEDLREVLLDANREKSNLGRLKQLTRVRPSHVVPSIPRNEEPRTGLSMGEHCAIMASEWDIGREQQDELAVRSHHNLTAAYERGFMEDLVNPYLGLERDQNLRPDSSAEKLAKLGPVFGGEEGTMTAANSTPLSDGASAVLLASEEWAKERDLPILAYFADGQTAAVDHVHKREGLLMAPAYAMPVMLDRADLSLQDFDLYEIHEAFAAQVLCTLRAWEDERFCRDRLGRDKPLGTIDREKLNVNGGSLAAGHPFAATGGRIVASLAKALYERGSGRGAISICAAAGQGVVAFLEAPGGVS